jgi:type IV secretory pathway VirJ component
MMTRGSLALGVLLLASVAPLIAAETMSRDHVLNVAPFGAVRVYVPERDPEQVVLFVSGDGGWNKGVVPMATHLRDLGALVVGIDIRSFLQSLERSGSCAYPAGDLEELSRSVQLRQHLPAYHRPILVGYSSGATLIYAALAAAPAETFAGGISLGFCPDLALRKPLCRGRELRSTPRANGVGVDLAPVRELGAPWYVLQGDIDQVCSPPDTRRFVESVGGGKLLLLPKVGHGFSVTRNWEPQYLDAYRAIVAAEREEPLPTAEAISDLPLVEVPAQPETNDDRLAVILTGDGGWAGIDKAIAGALAQQGVPTIGWSSLRYYWTPRTPEAAAADLQRILWHYLERLHKSRVVLVGYSFGADVLPFLVNRLPNDLRARVASVSLVGLSSQAAFAFHLASWLGGEDDTSYPTAPEVERLAGIPVVCLMGSDEKDSACSDLPRRSARVVSLPGGHHFGGDYERVATLILESTQAPHR